MASVLTVAALRARFVADTRGGGPDPEAGAAPALARALERVGWRAVRESSPEELASWLVHLVAACVHDHGDVDALVRDVAGLLRDHGPVLDGGLPPVDAYVPAAEEVLRQYLAPAPRAGLDFDRDFQTG